MNAFICPSDFPFTQEPPGFVPYVQNSYATNRGRNENIAFAWGNTAPPDPTAPYYQNCNGDPGDGMFGWQCAFKVANVTDGLSNTFLFGEVSRFVDEPSIVLLNRERHHRIPGRLLQRTWDTRLPARSSSRS